MVERCNTSSSLAFPPIATLLTAFDASTPSQIKNACYTVPIFSEGTINYTTTKSSQHSHIYKYTHNAQTCNLHT